MEFELKIGDLVWARMKGFSPWPGRIVKPGPNAIRRPRSNMQWIYFFGSCDHAWIEDNQIKPYEEFKSKFTQAYKTVKFKKAVLDIEDFINERKKNPSYELNVSILSESNEEDAALEITPKPKKVKKKVDLEKSDEGSASPVLSTKSAKKTVTKRRLTASPKTISKRIRTDSSTEENGISADAFEPASVTTSDVADTDGAELDLDPSKQQGEHTEMLSSAKIPTSTKRFGFLGLGNIGSAIVKNLINSGHRLYVWNRSPEKCEEIKQYADLTSTELVTICDIPFDVVQNSDIVFSCLGDPRSATEIVHGNCGVVHVAADSNALDGKGYVEMTGIDPETSKDIREKIEKTGGRYLEAQIQGSKLEAEAGDLIVLTAGDKTLFTDCQSCFKAMGKTAFYLGIAGYATKVNLIIQLMKGIALAGLAEGLALADRSGISSNDLLLIFKNTNLANPYLINKANLIVKKDFKNVGQAIEHMQKDMRLAVNLSDQMKQPLFMASTANEVYKHARRLGYDGHDASCIYMRTRH